MPLLFLQLAYAKFYLCQISSVLSTEKFCSIPWKVSLTLLRCQQIWVQTCSSNPLIQEIVLLLLVFLVLAFSWCFPISLRVAGCLPLISSVLSIVCASWRNHIFPVSASILLVAVFLPDALSQICCRWWCHLGNPHYEWLQREIETLRKASIIKRSISPWDSPIVIIPKKSAPGKPPQRRMCVDYRRLNKLQPEVSKVDGGKGCISLIPLTKIDEWYAKLKGYKVLVKGLTEWLKYIQKSSWKSKLALFNMSSLISTILAFIS